MATKLATTVSDSEAAKVSMEAHDHGLSVAQYIRMKLGLDVERKVGAPSGERNGRSRARREVGVSQ